MNDINIKWRATPMSGKWLAETPLGIMTCALRRAGKNRGYVWTATLPDGSRIATGADSNECKRNAEDQIRRLVEERS